MTYPTHHDHHSSGQRPVHQSPPQHPAAPHVHGYASHHPYHPHSAAPVNIVVQNTQHASPYGGGLVRVTDREKGPAVLLALFLGGLGFHRFYLGQTGMGVVYLLFSWTFVPAFIALFEALLLLLMSEREFDMKYNVGVR
jgi:TM2 domain-containing membrane protein YozV